MRKGLVLRPVGTASSLLVCGGHFILKFLKTMDGQNEVSVILGGKKARTLILTVTYHIPCLSSAGFPALSFIHYIQSTLNFCYVPEAVLTRSLPSRTLYSSKKHTQ